MKYDEYSGEYCPNVYYQAVITPPLAEAAADVARAASKIRCQSETKCTRYQPKVPRLYEAS